MRRLSFFAKGLTALKALLLAALLFGGGAAALAQQSGAPSDEADEAFRREMGEQFLLLERRLYDQNEIGLKRLEQVEKRIDESQHYIDRVFLIFGLSIIAAFMFIISHIRNREKAAGERVSFATRNAENLMRDIQREISRPEMEHLRISQILRRLLRGLRDQNRNIISPSHLEDVREASNDPYLPVSLHFIARVLVAEHDGRWNMAVQMLEQLREMDERDPDVLLHLSHVHKNIAEYSVDSKTRSRHQRLSYQYYGQFTAVMNSGRVQEEQAQITAQQSAASTALPAQGAEGAPPPPRFLPKLKPLVAQQGAPLPGQMPGQIPGQPPAAAPGAPPIPTPGAATVKPAAIPPVPRAPVPTGQPPSAAPAAPGAPASPAKPALAVSPPPAAAGTPAAPASPAKPALAISAPGASAKPAPTPSVPTHPGNPVVVKPAQQLSALTPLARPTQQITPAANPAKLAQPITAAVAPLPAQAAAAASAQQAQKSGYLRRFFSPGKAAAEAPAITAVPQDAAQAAQNGQGAQGAAKPAKNLVRRIFGGADKPGKPGDKKAAADKSAKAGDKKAAAADAAASTAMTAPGGDKGKKQRDKTGGKLSLNVLSPTKSAFAKMAAGMGALKKIVSERDGAMPLLPVPPGFEMPQTDDPQAMAMWGAIIHGDEAMMRATKGKNIRERLRLIESAINDYAIAQGHSTNEILYLNWGIALLAKALHLPEKKRAAVYHAAVDKFLAGNVVKPHYFDFHLASLYAIIGDSAECQKWLLVARDYGSLDQESLKLAPDFDSVRKEPWFDQFLQ